MRWHGDTLILQRNDNSCEASKLWSSEVPLTEDDYTDGTTSTKEYEPGTCCIDTMIGVGESCTAVDGSNTPKWSNWIKVCRLLQTFLSSRALQGCPRHSYKSCLAYWRAAQYVCCAESSKIRWFGLANELRVFMYYGGMLIALPSPLVTFAASF